MLMQSLGEKIFPNWQLGMTVYMKIVILIVL